MTDTVLDYSQAACVNDIASDKTKSEKDLAVGTEKELLWSSHQVALLQKMTDSGLSYFEIIKYICQKESSAPQVLEKVFKIFSENTNNSKIFENSAATNKKKSISFENSVGILAKPPCTSAYTQTENFYAPEVKLR